MKRGQRGNHRLWLQLILGMVAMLWGVGVSAQGDQIQPPAGLTEVRPVAPMPAFSYQR